MIEIKLIPHHKNKFLTLRLDKIVFQIKKKNKKSSLQESNLRQVVTI